MAQQIPSWTNLAFSVPFQLLLLAYIGAIMLGDLRRDYRRLPSVTIVLAGLVVCASLRLVAILLIGDSVYGDMCRSFYNNQLPDSFWLGAAFLQGGLAGWGFLGMIVAWLAARYWARGIRADKTTMFIAGVIVGLIAGVVLELAHIRWGHTSGIVPARLVLFAAIGGFLALVCKPFLVHDGRFQFSIKSLLAVTVIWALLLGLLCPEFSRYQEEENTLASLAGRLGKPIQCHRMEGLSGVAHVNYVFLPQCTIADSQIDGMIEEFRRLPCLNGVDIQSATISARSLKRLRDALPKVAFGGVGLGSTSTKEEILPATKDALHRQP